MWLNNYQIKVLAAILMLVDHVGMVFFPSIAILRVIGRFSFPLFVLLLVDGEKYTRNFGKYGLRLLVLGIVSQPIFALLSPGKWNILFTLLLGLLCLRLARVFPRWQLLIWLMGSTIAQILHVDYGAYGIAAIALIGSLRANLIWWMGWIALHLGILIIIPNFATFQFPAIFAPLLLGLANHQPGQKASWFYGFYPLHLLALWLLRLFLT